MEVLLISCFPSGVVLLAVSAAPARPVVWELAGESTAGWSGSSCCSLLSGCLGHADHVSLFGPPDRGGKLGWRQDAVRVDLPRERGHPATAKRLGCRLGVRPGPAGERGRLGVESAGDQVFVDHQDTAAGSWTVKNVSM